LYSVCRPTQTFDCVDHKILLEKLFYSGVKGTFLKLLAVVGPLLFLIYTNDIAKVSNFNIVLYADDINRHISGKKHEILEKQLTMS